ncbi:argininosuccinate lyase [Candidatus Woesearchaeota archaeon CG10_big_fil_rev_8_21_14_0_10_34_8]|nr:MAG: argininosuccinate lyase [Candidatus Woesearchaeota archaeon CG10_big_fil_rev_8_21_14_0_10_34_8]
MTECRTSGPINETIEMKLWQKKFNVNKEVETFTVGDDPKIDLNLVYWDCVASSAHGQMLSSINILTKNEYSSLKKGLKDIASLHEKNKFVIKQEDEDCHTAIENFLVKKIGDVGKKIHTGRSRNDQVLVATRLYTKAEIQNSIETALTLIKTLLKIAEQYKEVPMPGFTHMQKAMPSSVGLFFNAHAEALLDDIKILKNAYELNDQNPLGSAAGYGTQFKLNRTLTTKLLGFDKVQNNVLYCQNSRGKIESTVIHALLQTMQDCAKLANDILLFSMPQFQYFSFPKEYTTGSSIMPQKKNLDIFELVRGKASILHGNFAAVVSLTHKLPSGYNREYQLIKKNIINSFETTEQTLSIMNTVLKKIHVHEINCKKDCTPELFATDYANMLVQNGMPFRDAYQKVASEVHLLKDEDPVKNIMSKKHIGATGNLGFDKLNDEVKKYSDWLNKEEKEFSDKIGKLLN